MLLQMKFIIIFAHVQPGELIRLLKSNVASAYLLEGYQHILPYGFDHIAFILGLLLLSPRLKPILWQATAFTIAHSITLGLSMYHIIAPPLNLVEPLIALSILYVAVENLLSAKLTPFRIGIVFLFGLIHGLGFAGSLSQLNLTHEHFFTCLIMFNLGVELGQVTVIFAFYFFLARWFADKPYYRNYIVKPLSVLIGLMACCWIVQRIFFLF
ncbi:HupE/UreJ family protein [Chitinophaga silvisoli]|uniref:HupE/UreJ family protein n=2 Tax=Chitinophaga silvisoli TaxID=2291814 RepID=A0A3E1NU74_9BACT|nr:HupE/UreJ family protein [Chitinophaga silvisoli]